MKQFGNHRTRFCDAWGSEAVCQQDVGLDDVRISQHHCDGVVRLTVDVVVKCQSNMYPFSVDVVLTHPDGTMEALSQAVVGGTAQVVIEVTQPALWWPAGYGNQPLYQLETSIVRGRERLARRNFTIGLRTIEIRRTAEAFGESIACVVNGIDLFLKGATYYPERTPDGRSDSARMRHLLQACVEANFNMIRVSSGEEFPEDEFYDCCDKLGLIIWQTFTVPKRATVWGDNIKRRWLTTVQNKVLRIRHHPSIGIWSLDSAWPKPVYSNQGIGPEGGFRFAKDLAACMYLLELQRAQAIRSEVEAARRQRIGSIGVFDWPLNQRWSGITGSSLDHSGQWQALHYFAQRFYAPVLVSVCSNDTRVTLYVTNDRVTPVEGFLDWQLLSHVGEVVLAGRVPVYVAGLSTWPLPELDFSEELSSAGSRRTLSFAYQFECDGSPVAADTVQFCPVHRYNWCDPALRLQVRDVGEAFEIVVSAKHLAKYVELCLPGGYRFSDNWFDVVPGQPKIIYVHKSWLFEPLNAFQFAVQLHVRSYYDSYSGA
ncbi:glycoside hydrolase family 2 protein [Alicyclobacillus suci]|uniref:glycoside hydrolase family 2 protein n=1 Tax=Alicyclobacillus suci TaxID=2816080 RepID=UPI001A909922|nr:glycoside hydrolase family 2 protein [Alicyclobacillus suci]